jgi:hypothetical protein
VSDVWLKRLVVATIVLLVVYHIGTLMHAAFGAVAGALTVALVAVVSFVSARFAWRGEASAAWFLVPTVLFTLASLGVRLWLISRADRSWMRDAIELLPFLIGFAVPIFMLLFVYLELRQRVLAGTGETYSNRL